jgi:hypothetical protein
MQPTPQARFLLKMPAQIQQGFNQAIGGRG